MKLSENLRSRGFVYQFSSETLEEITDEEKRTIYLGVDPTAESIHVGNLAVYMLLRHFKDAGHKVILLIGGGTGMIGDPKPDVERPLTPPEVIKMRVEKLAEQSAKLLGGEVEVVNNHDWLSQLNLIDFLRDIGKHFTVNNLMKKDAISKRLAGEEGITYTEFAYPLLQAYDFWHLFKTKKCDVQVSGSDQWGNITAGVDLIRRKEEKTAYALTIPLVTDKASGKKFGKSEGNAVWLDPTMTSPYAFFQFWLNANDESVELFLKLFTLLSLEEIVAIMQQQDNDRGERIAQKRLALEVTALVHTREVALVVAKVSELLFLTQELTAEDYKVIAEHAPVYEVELGASLMSTIVAAGLASSNREARDFFDSDAISLNNKKTAARELNQADFIHSIAILRRGKKNISVLKLK